MSTLEALRVAEQLSPLPQVAHEALATLAVYSRRWLFWRDVIMSTGPILRDVMRSMPVPQTPQDLEANIDQAILISGWEPNESEAIAVVDPWRSIDTAPQDTVAVALLVRFTCCIPHDNRAVITAGRQDGRWVANCEHTYEPLGWCPLPPIPAIPTTAATLFAVPTSKREH